MLYQLSHRDRITKAIVRLQRNQPFFAYLVMRLNFMEVDETTKHLTPSMGINYKGDVLYQPKFLDELTDEQLQGVIIHEAMHLGLSHMLRAGKRNKMGFNIATDCVVNDILVTAGFKLNPGGLNPDGNHSITIKCLDGKKIDGLDAKPAEEVYEEVMKGNKCPPKPPPGGKGNGSGPGGQPPAGRDDGGFDDHEYADDLTESEKDRAEHDNKQTLVEARNYAKARGNMPVGLDRMIEKILPPKVNWKHVLHSRITQHLPFDHTYARPHKKSLACGVYMPSPKREGLDVVVALDASGSISKEQLTEFLSEVIGIGRGFVNLKMMVLSHDAEVTSALAVETGNVEKIMSWTPKGGGGTDHKPVWKWINDNRPQTRLCVCLSDGCTDFGKPPGFEVIWAITPDGVEEDKIPFGTVLKLPREG